MTKAENVKDTATEVASDTTDPYLITAKATDSDDESPPTEEINLKLTDLPGVGPSKAEALEEAGFGTIEALQAAGVTDLAAVSGISENLAEKIKTSLDKGDN